jgi:dTDP-4-amino-4,6-dideoxygalactose transaminase
MTWKVTLADLDLDEKEDDAVLSVLHSRWLTSGEVTRRFEEAFANYVGARHAIAVGNATVGLHLASVLLGLEPGDEVIVPSLTFVATVAAILYVGAKPIFADITSEIDLTLSPESIAERITDRTRAIVVMHYGGYACDMTAILRLARKYNLSIIEDAAHAPGSMFEGRKLGTWGKVGVFSFFSNKNLATGEGGMLVTDSDEIAKRARLLSSHAMTSMTWDRHQGHAWSYDVVDLGYNYRMDEIRCAIGLVQLAKLDRNNQKRRDLTKFYHHQLSELVPDVGLPFVNHRGQSAAHLLPILLPAGQNRIKFMEKMKEQGIQTSIHYPPVHRFSYYNKQVTSKLLPITEIVTTREVTLPLHPLLNEDQVNLVVSAVRVALRESN